MNTLKITTLVIIFTLLGSTYGQTTRNGLIVSWTIEGTQNTELSVSKNTSNIEDLKHRIRSKTIEQLKKLFSLDSIQFAKDRDIEFKKSLNRFKGVRKIDDDEKAMAQNIEYIFKIKCDIAFNETTAGTIINERTSRAVVYLAIGVFDKNGERVAIYKGKYKDDFILVGENSENMQWLSIQDFESAYNSALFYLNKD